MMITETLMHYIEGTANGQPDRLRKAFHPDFNRYIKPFTRSTRLLCEQAGSSCAILTILFQSHPHTTTQSSLSTQRKLIPFSHHPVP
jgi:Putative lumazine-binding